MSTIYAEIYKIIQTIPRGRVLTYGLISNMIGGRMSAQGVGWALKALGSEKVTAPNSFNSGTVPWQRVVNTQGGTSTHKVPGIPPDLQRNLLEAEGIMFDDEGKMDLHKYLWMEGLSDQLLHPKSSKSKKSGAVTKATKSTKSTKSTKRNKASKL